MKLSLSDQVEHLKRQIKSKERDLMHSNDVGYNMGLATAIDLVNAVFGSPTAEDEVAALPNTEQDEDKDQEAGLLLGVPAMRTGHADSQGAEVEAETATIASGNGGSGGVDAEESVDG